MIIVEVFARGGAPRGPPSSAIIAQLVNRSATADFRAIKILLDIVRDIERQTELTTPEISDFSAGSPGAARGRVLLRKLIVKNCPQITVNGPVSASSILDDAATPFFEPQMQRGLAGAQHAVPTRASTAPRAREGIKTHARQSFTLSPRRRARAVRAAG